MIRVNLPGLHRVRRKLASGQYRVHYYAWRGGPKINAEFGTPEFIKAFAELTKPGAAATREVGKTLSHLSDQFQRSTEFTELAPKTRKDYLVHLKRIETEFGDMPIRLLSDRRVRADFLAWRDKLAAAGKKRQTDYTFSVFGRLLSWAKKRGLTDHNALEDIGRLYAADRNDKVWSHADEAKFLSIAPPHLRLPILLALWTGQRQGDLLKLTWKAYDGRFIRLRQSKTGARVVIPVGGPLKAALDAEPRAGLHMLLTTEGTPWTSDGFRSSWRRTVARAEIEGLTFHDLRGTSVTRLAIAGATEAEIAVFTGLSLVTVRTILDAHYLSRDVALAESAVRKLETKNERDG